MEEESYWNSTAEGQVITNGRYSLCRPRNLRLLNKVILEDEFDDAAKAAFVGYVFSDAYLDFLQRNICGHTVLDIGCGSGCSFKLLPAITHAIDANPVRAATAASAADGVVEVHEGAAECLPFPAKQFSSVLYLHGFFQARSNYEAVMEVNRVLEVGGRFIFDFPHFSRTNLEFGVIIESRSYLRVLADFGFELVERRSIDEWDEAVCVEKVEDFNYARMKKLQLIEKEPGLFAARNLNNEDYTLR